MIGRREAVPHIWHTSDDYGKDCRHLAMCEEGAIQAHLLHYGMMGCNGVIKAVDEGTLNAETDRGTICFDPNDVLYGLSFPNVIGCEERDE